MRNILHTIYMLSTKTSDLDHPRIVLHKPRIRALRTNHRIASAILGWSNVLNKARMGDKPLMIHSGLDGELCAVQPAFSGRAFLVH